MSFAFLQSLLLVDMYVPYDCGACLFAVVQTLRQMAELMSHQCTGGLHGRGMEVPQAVLIRFVTKFTTSRFEASYRGSTLIRTKKAQIRYFFGNTVKIYLFKLMLH